VSRLTFDEDFNMFSNSNSFGSQNMSKKTLRQKAVSGLILYICLFMLLFALTSTVKASDNKYDYHRRYFSINIWKGISIYGKYSDDALNHFVINLTKGESARLEGMEFSVLSSKVFEDAYGLQIAGIGNHVYGQAAGIQLSGFGSIVDDDFTGLQFGGAASVVGGDMFGAQLSLIAAVSGKDASFAQLGGIASVAGGNVSLVQIGGLAAVSGEDATGLQLSGIASVSGERLNGIQAGGLAAVSGKSAFGIQAGGISSVCGGDFTGIQVGGAGAVAEGDVKAIQLSGIASVAGNSVSGIQAGGLAAVVGHDANIAQLSGLASVAGGSVHGIQFGGMAGVSGENVIGIQAGGIAAVTGETLKGIQISGLASVAGEEVRGIQISGLANYTPELRFLQIATINTAEYQSGLQIGIFNVAEDLKGVQIGLFNNVYGECDGLPLGFVSHVAGVPEQRDFWYSETNLLNYTFRTGTEKIHSLFNIAIAPWENPDIWTIGGGLGYHQDLVESGKAFVEADMMIQKINENEFWTDNMHWFATGKLTAGFFLSEKVALIAGPSFNYYYSKVNNGYNFAPSEADDVDPGKAWTQSWIGYSAGLRWNFESIDFIDSAIEEIFEI